MTADVQEFSPEDDEFGDALASLVERGCNFLVVGLAPRGAHDCVSRRLFGEAVPSRRRLLVLLGRNQTGLERRLGTSPVESTPGTVAVVRHSMLTRSAATTSTPEPFASQVESDSLTELGCTIADDVLAFVQTTTHREPGWLRVGFDALLPLVEHYEREAFFRFLRTVTQRIRAVSGMGHFHLSVPIDDPLVDQIRSIFDGIVEIGVGDDGFQQRWHLTAEELSSTWHAL